MTFILGSGSPRRQELLGQLGVHDLQVCPPDIDETPLRGEKPRAYCMRIANGKLDAIAAQPDDIVLCADTTVAVGRRILGKPKDAQEAAQFLALMSGRRHTVITAVCVKRGAQRWARDVVTTLKMKRLTNTEISAYIATGDWQGKAGGYGIQGEASKFIPWLQGSYTGVVGLPLAETYGLLTAAGYEWSSPV